MRSVLIPALWLGLVALAPAPLVGQIVRGQVVEGGTGNPVEGAMVLLLDLDGNMVRRVLSDASGGFILNADRPGPHLIRVDRIGYESIAAERFDIPVGGTFRLITVPIRPVELMGLEVESSRRCQLRGEQGATTAQAWEEARKALEAAAWTLESGAYRYTLMNFERNLEPDERTVVNESRRFDRGTGQAPYVSAPAADLAENGFVRENPDGTLTYYAPDAASFLSDSFLDTHCMRLASVKDGEIGLAFEPIRGRRLPEIRGTLWLEAATAQLRRLEFNYVNLPRRHDMGNAGGEVVFGALPNGSWVVREWNIRMPLLATNPQRTRLIVRGYQVRGGVVWRVIDRSGTTVVEAATASLAGTVMDSLGVRPLSDAVVRTSDGTAEATTQGAGTFLLPGLAEGLQTLEVSHPSLDSVGLGPIHLSVEAVAGEVTSTRLQLPGVEDVLMSACAGTPEMEGATATLLGHVRRGGAPAGGVPVRVRWLGQDRRGFEVTAQAAPPSPGTDGPLWQTEEEDPRWLRTTMDGRGVFMVCALPRNSQMRVEVGLGEDRVVRTVTLRPSDSVVFVPITLSPSREP